MSERVGGKYEGIKPGGSPVGKRNGTKPGGYPMSYAEPKPGV